MNRRVLPSLSALRAFEAAARHRSFRKAAEELHVTHSAVSHQVKHLEQTLGAALFWRRGRQVELTEAGISYLPVLRDAFDRIAEGARQIRANASIGDLTVQVYVTVAVRWLMPRLHLFQTAHPDLFVRLSTSYLDWDFDADNADVGIIHVEHAHRPELHYLRLFETMLVPVCSPALLHAGTGLRQPVDLVNHALLRLYTAADDWSLWLEAAGLPPMIGKAGAKFDSYLLAIEAAIDGQGVALVPEFLVARDVRAGRLALPFALGVTQPGAWYLVCRKEMAADRRIVRFQAWLAGQIAADPDLRPGASR